MTSPTFPAADVVSLQRQADHTFKDEDLAKLLHDATEYPAVAFRARGTPASMRLHEIMGMLSERLQKGEAIFCRSSLINLNSYPALQYLGLKPYNSFLDWNPDKEIADAAEKLHGHIDCLELYVGLQAEEAKPVSPGNFSVLETGLYGNSFFEQALHAGLHPFNMTAWGFADCQRDPNAFDFGSTLGRLFLRNLPNHFTENSVYTFFPLMTLDSMKTHLKKLKFLDQYDLSRPAGQTAVQKVTSYTQIADILQDRDTFNSPYVVRAARVIHRKGFYAVDGTEVKEKMYKALGDSPESIDKIEKFFHDTTCRLIDFQSFALVGKKTYSVELVRDVLKYVPIYWAACDIAGFCLKTNEHPHGHYTPEELYQILGDIYSFVFLDIEASKVMVLRVKVTIHVRALLGHIKNHLGQGIMNRNSIASILSKPKKVEHKELVKRLTAISGSCDELANTISALMVGSTVEISLALTNMVNLYLGPYKDAELRRLANATDTKNPLDGFVYEALSFDSPLQGVYLGNLSVKNGDRIFLNVAQANLDELIFPTPTTVDVARGGKHTLYGDGAFSHLGEQLTVKVMAEVLRAVFQYDNVRRAPGQSGTLRRFKDYARPELRYAYLDRDQFFSAWPTSLSIVYDAPATSVASPAK
ncbi:hypothetical protein D9615_002103 [Tricholomella constricta]|uniref:Uncharacterized protein n=1 Tax=Tricholomella constricta TaxID=117010 RepID=A0A8H5HPY3_9AGAR|nr:hypothetical protein D9615_002103 [Tricholomella constricta]